ncbi:MAG TPA: SgcJ/EcaC family oxidoreductase [Candidatus Sulfotelmatobacter sp.]|nr:SgcJ/EcaC family oxidoreductase [Candidatus Sulfotelmatobacter sp.]
MLRSRSVVLSLALLSLAFAAGCASEPQKPAAPPDTRKADEAAIRAASAEWSKASEAKDLEKSVSYYADDAVFLVDKGALVKGKDAIRLAWKDALAPEAPTLTFATTYVEVARSGDIGYEYGTYDLTTPSKKGPPKVDKGKYATVWKKQADGNWKAIVDIDNTGI